MKYIKDQEELAKHFDAKYFDSINYIDYEKRQEKYSRTAKDIKKLFDMQVQDNILDFGCATGMLMKSLKDEGLSVYGYDISDYALGKAQRKVCLCQRIWTF